MQQIALFHRLFAIIFFGGMATTYASSALRFFLKLDWQLPSLFAVGKGGTDQSMLLGTM